MEETFVERVYETLTDMLLEEYRLPGVENAFADGAPCDELYNDVQESYLRLCERYGVGSDNDVEEIINDMLDICRILGCKMYEYGARFGAQTEHQEFTVGEGH